MSEREKIKEIFLCFVNALEKDEIDTLNEILAEDVTLESTNYGYAIGKEDVKNKLRWQGLPINYSRSKIFNFVAFTEKDFGKQSAVVSSLVGQNDEHYFHYFQYSGYFLNDYVKVDGRWKINKIKFNLDMEDGNTLFVKGWWNLIDYRFFEGAYPYPIVSEIEAPWRVIKNPDYLGTDEEQVVDAYYRYCWGIDHADMEILLSGLDDYVEFSKGAIHLPLDPNPGSNSILVLDVIKIMKYKRYKEPVMEHIFKIEDVKITGDKAQLITYRYEPHRLGTKKLTKLNMNEDFYTYVCEYEYVKKKDGWKMCRNIPKYGVFSETSYDQKKFF